MQILSEMRIRKSVQCEAFLQASAVILYACATSEHRLHS